jgi:PAS domain S-box-containing protein
MSGLSPDPVIRDGAFVGSPAAFRAVLDALTAAIVVFDRDGLVQMANRQAEELFEAPREGLVGLRMTDPRYPVIGEDGRPVGAEEYPIAVVLRTGRRIDSAPLQIALPDGTPLWISVSATPLFEEGDDRAHAVVASMTDITRYKEAELELARSNSDLAQFASVVAHDLSAPLTVIAGMAEMVQRRAAESIGEHEHLMLERIAAAARNGQSLISELLQFAKAGQAELHVEEVPLGPLVDEIAGVLQGPDAPSRVGHGALPAVRADRVQLRQVLQNLVGNALKFSEGPVRVEASADGAGWRVSVRDEGIGIDPADQERIFGMLTRTPSADGFPGTGIGLAVCRRIVDRHGGRIWVESAPGKGSTFSFSLPG